MRYNGGSRGDDDGRRWQSKGVLSTDQLLDAKVPILNAGDVGYGGTSTANCMLGSSRERAVHPIDGVGFLVSVLATFPFCICFAGPHKLSLKVFRLKISSFLRTGVCKNKPISCIIFLALLSKKTQNAVVQTVF